MATLYYRPNQLMYGPAVRRFQEMGEAVLGEDFLENDGWFGKDTDALAKKVQEKLGVTVDGVVGRNTWNKIFEHLGRTESGATVTERDGVKIIDGRDVFDPPSGYYNKKRDWSKIEGVLLHQTGCWMPESEQTWARVRCHCGITRKGVIILTHPFDWIIWHGNNLSKQTIGLEVAGNFYGIEGVERSWWKPGGGPHDFTDAQEQASEVLFHIIKEEFDKNGGTWSKVYSHRQSSDQRTSDPGQSLWQKIAMVWHIAIGGDDGGPDYCVGSGKPVPKEWNPEYPRKFWG